MRDGGAIVFAHERANLRGLLAWLIPVGALLALTCALQRSFVESGLLEAKLQGLPAAMRHALGLELVDFRRPPVYLATNFLLVVLPSSLFAGLLGAGSSPRRRSCTPPSCSTRSRRRGAPSSPARPARSRST